jgi:AcrR family transcriptional regulator
MSSHHVSIVGYARRVPKLWTETIETHRREVHTAILEKTAALVAEHGLASVTMSQIAEATGIGRATLYKYFPDIEAILVAWHERHVSGHIERLAEVRDRATGAGERIEAVLEAYALISHERAHGHDRSPEHQRLHEHRGSEIDALVHREEHVGRVQRRLNDFFRDLLAAGVKTGDVRKDVAPEELARYCIHALEAAGGLPSKTAVRRLVAVTLSGVRPQR